MADKKVNVILDPVEPEGTEIIAASIIRISDGFGRLIKSGLNNRALCVLLKHHTGVSMHEIQKILNCLPALKDIYCTKPKGKAR